MEKLLQDECGCQKIQILIMSESIIKIDQLPFIKINESTGYTPQQVMAFDAVILDTKDSNFCQTTILAIRRHHLPEVYLKPIFVTHLHPNGFIHLHALSDGVYMSEHDGQNAVTKTKKIFQKSLDLHLSYPPNAHGAALKKALDYLYCRENRTLQPHLDPFSIIGYSYPEMSVSFETHEEAQILDALEWAEKQDLIWPDFQERIYVCNHCSGGFLSYREVCPHCQSSNTKGEDLIHHFPCAYIGPTSDFTRQQDDKMVCPKCDKGLHHIGVDYDKPSVLYHCNNCDTKFQDLYVKAKCLSCKNDVEVQYLNARTINTYKLTNKGRHAITQGFENNGSAVKENIHWISEDAFLSLLNIDARRSIKENISIQLIGIEFANAKEFERLVGAYRFKKFIEEFYLILQGDLNDVEYLYVDQGRKFWLIKYANPTFDIIEWIASFDQRALQLIQHNYDGFKADLHWTHTRLQEHESGKDAYSNLNRKLSLG